MTLKELLGSVTPAAVSGETSVAVSDLCVDSRLARPGSVFFAVRGAKVDGNRFAKAAGEAGAVAVVSELAAPPAPVALKAAWVQVPDLADAMGRMADLFFGHPSRALTVIGVTGTNGKTTTTYFLESIAAACGKVPAVAGTVDYRLAGKVLSSAPNTTPISLELLRLMARMRDGGATHLAMEVSSHALSLKRVERVDFDAAVFTNLRRDHLDFHQTPEAYFEAKARLFDLLVKASSSKKSRVAVINADDPRAEALKRRAAGAQALLYGLKAGEVRAEAPEASLLGTRFKLSWRGRSLPAEIRLPGEHNLYNALAAATAALALGLPSEGVLKGLEALTHVPGRLEPVVEGQPFSVLVDYAHTDSALEAVLTHLAKLPHKRLLTVVGCGGDRDRTKRGPMGAVAGRGSDLVFLTSDNPRSEDPAAILKDIEEGFRGAGLSNYRVVADRREAIRLAVEEAGEGDIVLIAGKGHETTQISREGTLPFDDRAVAAESLRARTRA